MSGQRKRIKPEKPLYLSGEGRKIWRVVDGAIRDALTHHPDYLTTKGAKGYQARRSIAKRVAGAVMSYLEQSKQGRSGELPASVNDG